MASLLLFQADGDGSAVLEGGKRMIPRKVAIGAGVLAVAGLGTVLAARTPIQSTDPLPVSAAPVASYAAPVTPEAVALVTTPSAVVAAPAGERVAPRTRTVARRAAARPTAYVHKRSKKHSAMIIGGSTVGGAGVGALIGGKKGGLIGGLVGGAAGTVYDRKTHKKVRYQ
jgi:hypothetical protein